MTELQKLKIRHFMLELSIIRTSMWLTMLYEFYGPLELWRKIIDNFVDEQSAEIKDDEIKNLIYGNHEKEKPYPYRPLVMTHIFTVLEVFRVNKLIRYFPIEYRVRNKSHTGKRIYEKEKWNYRVMHSVASTGADLSSRAYQEYKALANKYNWPYIVNSNDYEV